MYQRVATSRSRGGTCARCRKLVKPGQRIHKIWDGKITGTTGHGNGMGEWWCQQCYEEVLL